MSFLVAAVYDALLARTERLCIAEWRRRLVAPLGGRVLEIGSGTGHNLEYYGRAIERLVAVEPDRHMRRKLEHRARDVAISDRVEISSDSGEHLAYPDGSFDSVVATLVLCSVADVQQTVREAHRVLRRHGELLLIEHVRAPEGTSRSRWQERLNPIWSRCSGGCQLDRDPRPALERVGFAAQRITMDEMLGAPSFLRTVLRGTWLKE